VSQWCQALHLHFLRQGIQWYVRPQAAYSHAHRLVRYEFHVRSSSRSSVLLYVVVVWYPHRFL
jgi:hypothetical protein